MAEFIGTFKGKNVTKSLVWMFAILGVLVIVRTVASPDTGPWTPDSRRWSLPATGDWGPRGDGPGPGARTRHDRGQPVTDNDQWWQHSIGTPHSINSVSNSLRSHRESSVSTWASADMSDES